jgi:hypothetical protein
MRGVVIRSDSGDRLVIMHKSTSIIWFSWISDKGQGEVKFSNPQGLPIAAGEWYEISVAVSGDTLSLYVNDVLYGTAQSPVLQGTTEVGLYSMKSCVLFDYFEVTQE